MSKENPTKAERLAAARKAADRRAERRAERHTPPRGPQPGDEPLSWLEGPRDEAGDR